VKRAGNESICHNLNIVFRAAGSLNGLGMKGPEGLFPLENKLPCLGRTMLEVNLNAAEFDHCGVTVQN
jgi:hypothetical protein